MFYGLKRTTSNRSLTTAKRRANIAFSLALFFGIKLVLIMRLIIIIVIIMFKKQKGPPCDMNGPHDAYFRFQNYQIWFQDTLFAWRQNCIKPFIINSIKPYRCWTLYGFYAIINA
ncbi:MAG TPA: hypothetical protein DEP72_02695 [Clostridiales bacterium]|nr:MAG: hypothetical protein A2Y18_08210 [Clostridiales bacterium GWD2_32_19]HCC07063.1 hypothetical protein [Clostridiales bacterium]